MYSTVLLLLLFSKLVETNSTLSNIDAKSGFVTPRKSVEPVRVGGRRLKYVHAIWKHGDRAPKQLSYPDDKYDMTYWPRGWGQITNLGMKQMRDLGHYFRTTYADHFISSEYDRDEVRVKSSSDSRALTAAQAFLYGLFPPIEDHEFFDHTLNWQPIPVHSFGTEESDVMLRPTGFLCPAYENIKDKVITAVEIDLLTKYADLVEFLRPIIYPGMENPPKLRLRDITRLVDIQREIVHNLTQPSWVRKRWPQYARKSTLDIVFEMRLVERNAESSNPSLSYLAGGLLLGDWLRKLQSIGRRETVRPSKMMLYSAHDATLVSLLYLLQANWDGYKLLFRRAGLNEKLILKGCIRSCPLDKFLNLLRASAIYNTESLSKVTHCNAEHCVYVYFKSTE
ncbi:histidine phosphatase superfamily (branch 2) domain-containing protein [Ditylenchus destructor]|uniref:Histidine phosphatase superfamily (Branch 2) domain-containing protein n=1 Tax=Ditylenchus destructor TaxID=166010 RepID=A0AAD4QZ57_9BILA|nr:histidine phosphatase superfamily (branch 2) domain-containing protein [Ditylenchus destructor]